MHGARKYRLARVAFCSTQTIATIAHRFYIDGLCEATVANTSNLVNVSALPVIKWSTRSNMSDYEIGPVRRPRIARTDVHQLFHFASLRLNDFKSADRQNVEIVSPDFSTWR
jgi:hypothetical protein